MDEDQARQLDEEIGAVTSPAIVARAALKKHQEQQGMQFADPEAPVGPDAKAMAWMEDQEVPGSYLSR